MRREKKKRKKSRWKRILLSLLLLFIVGGYVLITEFSLEKMTVEGSTRYTEDEIQKMIERNGYMDNTLFIYFINRFRPIEGIPFIDKITVTLTGQHEVQVDVFEKAIAGCVTDMGKYIYFDRDGYVLESTEEKFEDVPCVEGLTFQQFVLHEKLPLEDEETFKEILKVTQLIKENDLQIDRVRFDVTGQLILYKGDITVRLGKGEHLEEKMMNLAGILNKAEDLKGVLHMEEFSTTSDMVPFTPETKKKKQK